MQGPGSITWLMLVSIALGSSALGALIGKLFERTGTRTETLRQGYADATRALNAWGQFPLRIRRRIDDEAETLRSLEVLGADIQASLAYSMGWVSADSSALGELYGQLLVMLRGEVTLHARQAWSQPPASSAARMNIAGPPSPQEIFDEWSGVIPAEWLVVQRFSMCIRYRFGWRRIVMTPSMLRRRLKHRRVLDHLREAFADRSIRLMTARPLQSEQSETGQRADYSTC